MADVISALPVSETLLAHLDLLFPERCPNPDDTEREVWMKAGERRVVRLLQRALKEQQDNILQT